jgi:hypothetical protein
VNPVMPAERLRDIKRGSSCHHRYGEKTDANYTYGEQESCGFSCQRPKRLGCIGGGANWLAERNSPYCSRYRLSTS